MNTCTRPVLLQVGINSGARGLCSRVLIERCYAKKREWQELSSGILRHGTIVSPPAGKDW